ncbi:MAG: fructosamine kinase family protein [Chloroflexi bacterium]|nr:fructosamine kinase family protein [Chloroflexota bacterium]MCC6892400.1 fructosamine kinase family protein [Anaerolineae bacterium]
MLLSYQIEEILGTKVMQTSSLSGGCIGEVYKVELEDGREVVAKVADGSGATLAVEGYMLRYLREHSQLPVPEVYHSVDTLLLMEYIEGESELDAGAQEHAAELLAALHTVRGQAFGLERDTVIGGVHQPNKQHDQWIPFFREQRLLYAAHEAARVGRLPAAVLARVEKLAGQLERWLLEPEYPSLIHGDMWTTNILATYGQITGFIDPAIYYAHPEIELAFSTLFGTFGQPFFHRYHQLRPIVSGFFEERRDLYNLYPLLVHVRLFGGGYVRTVEQILRKYNT